MNPPQVRDQTHLHPEFKTKLQAWLAAAKKAGFNILVYETTRTLDRQKYLYGQGRSGVAYGRGGSVVTYTLDSLHRYRCAVDLVPLGRNGAANWGGYGSLYVAVPPSKFGLEILNFERPHVQIKGGQATAHKLGIQPW
jgi:D-alanyl-D-alanine carboxypeptidase